MEEFVNYHIIAHSLEDLARFFGCWTIGASPSEMTDEIKEEIYDATDCGAWFTFNEEDNSVQVGSIVEGSDAEFSMPPITFPFNTRQIVQSIEHLENLVEDAWNEANQEDDDYED